MWSIHTSLLAGLQDRSAVLSLLGSDLLFCHEVGPPFAQSLLGLWSGQITPDTR